MPYICITQLPIQMPSRFNVMWAETFPPAFQKPTLSFIHKWLYRLSFHSKLAVSAVSLIVFLYWYLHRKRVAFICYHKVYQRSSKSEWHLYISVWDRRVRGSTNIYDKKLSYYRETAWCVLSVVILPITTQQCRNYLYDKSWPNRWYEVGGLLGGNVS